MKVSRAGAVVVDDDVRAGHGRPDIIDHVAGVAARVLQVWIPAEREREDREETGNTRSHLILRPPSPVT